MFSAFRQQIITQDVLIAAKMGICIARTVINSRADGNYFFAWRVITVR